MNSLADSFRRYDEKAGQQVGQGAGQQVSHSTRVVPPQWDSQKPQKTAKNQQVSRCPNPIGTGHWDSGQKSGTAVGTTGGTPPQIDERIATARLREWHGHLSRIDQLQAPEGWSLNDWLTLTDDALWLYENHARYAVRHGWNVHDLFGVRAGMPHGGGLAQYLRSSRKVLFDGPIAHVTLFGVTSKLNPACGHGLPLLWQLK